MKTKVKKLSSIDVLVLQKMEKKYNCPFYFPPFQKRLNPFFDITKMDHNPIKSKRFLASLGRMNICHKRVVVGDRRFLEIVGGS